VASAALQVGCRVFEGAKDAVEVDVQHAFERLLIGLSHGPIGRDTGIGDDEVEATQTLRSTIDRRMQSGAIAHIGFPPQRGGAKVIGEGPQAIGFEPNQRHPGASCDRKPCDPLSDAAGSSGDDQFSANQAAPQGITPR
jgi:hypothetical protein